MLFPCTPLLIFSYTALLVVAPAASSAASFWPAQLQTLSTQELPTLSASSLQTFVDCPRQFALRYLGGYQLDPQPQQTFRARELGTMAHAIIAAWAQSPVAITLDALIEQQLAKTSFATPYERWKAQEDLYYHVAPVLKELHKLEAQAPRTTWKFEYNLAYRFDPVAGAEEKTDVQGRIDLIIPHPTGLMLFDFKRNQCPSAEDIRQFKKIQLWFYATHGIRPEQLGAWGLLKLANLKESTIMTFSAAAQTCLQELNFMQAKICYEPALLKEDLPRYQQQEAQWIAQMKKGDFARNPQGPGCDWCPWYYVCGE